MWFVALVFSGGCLIYVLTPLWSHEGKVVKTSKRDITGKADKNPTEDLRNLESEKQSLVERYRVQKDQFESGSLAQGEWQAEKKALEKQYQKLLARKACL